MSAIDSSIPGFHGIAAPSQPTPPAAPSHPLDGRHLVLAGLNWATYRRISDAFTGLRVRITYDRGRLELMVTSYIHEKWGYFLARCVYVLTEEAKKPVSSAGSMTCEREDLDRSIEPDKCFYLENEPLIRAKKTIELSKDPPPDLAVETEVSRRAIKQLPIYEALKVPEVWRTNGETVTFHVLQQDGKYAVADYSRNFPFLRSEDLAPFLRRWGETDENTLLREFRAWVREQLSKQKPD